MPTELLPAFIAIIFAAATVQGAAGFGFALVAVSTLSLLAPLVQATPLLALINLPVSTYLLLKLRRHVEWRELGLIMLGMCVGVPVGVYVLVNWPQEVLLRILAVVLLFAAVRTASRQPCNDDPADDPAGPTASSKLSAVGAGWAAGSLGGAFGTSGPPIIAYVYCRPWTKERRTGSLQALFLLNCLLAVSLFTSRGLYTRELLLVCAACLPGALLGMLVGHSLFRRIPQRGLEIFVAVFLSILAVKFMVWP